MGVEGRYCLLDMHTKQLQYAHTSRSRQASMVEEVLRVFTLVKVAIPQFKNTLLQVTQNIT